MTHREHIWGKVYNHSKKKNQSPQISAKNTEHIHNNDKQLKAGRNGDVKTATFDFTKIGFYIVILFRLRLA